MTKYMKEHEKYVLDAIKQKERLNDLLDYHNLQISWLQHERLVHLIVLMITSLLLMLSLIGMILSNNILLLILLILLGLLTFAYVIHYFRLENTIQRWYRISNTINTQLTNTGTNPYNYNEKGANQI